MSAAFDFAPDTVVPAPPRRHLSAVAPLPANAPAPCAPNVLGRASVTVLHRPDNATRAAPLRLTRRGVVTLSAAVIALGAALVWIAAASASGGEHGAPASHVQAVTVAPGDTLWSIAGRVAPDRDPRAEVAALQRRNHLSDVDLMPGQRLAVP